MDNQVLAKLSEADRSALAPHLTLMEVRKGQVLIQQGAEVTHLHLPITAELSNSMIFSDGRSVETSVVGREGVSGLAAFLAVQPNWWQVVVQTSGQLFAIDAASLKRQAERSPALMHLMLGLTYDYQCQAAQSAACNALHDVQPQLARWLLLIADRTRSDTLQITQQDLADMLGAQRTTITGAASALRAAKAIRYRRGVIVITDRPRLEALACECYEAQKQRSQIMGLPAAD